MVRLSLKTSFETLCSHPESFLSLYEDGILEMEVLQPVPGSAPVATGRDEIHVVAQGSGELSCSGVSDRVGRGDVLFLENKVEHCYANFTSDFRLWVFFMPDGEYKSNKEAEFFCQAA